MKEDKMKISSHQQKILLLVFLFIIIRIPISFLPDFYNVQGSLANSILRGNIIYCDFEQFTNNLFWQQHVFPPGFYIFMLTVFFSQNILLIAIELLNLFLIYKILIKMYGESSALTGITLLSFFPLSILNCGFFPDPMGLCISFILLGIYFFNIEKPVLSSISLALGTLIIYIPAIIIIPIVFYYFKNKDYGFINIGKYIGVFLITLILGCLPFLILCPEKFIFYLNVSFNDPQSSNFLMHENFILSIPFNTIILNIFGFNLKVINIIQISILFLTIYLIYKKFSFVDIKDIVISSIILISMISITTFYIHLRFMYWICLLSIFLLVYNSENFEKEFNNKKIILIGTLCFVISCLALGLSAIFNLENNINNLNYWTSAILLLFLYTIAFIALGFLNLKNYHSKLIVLYVVIITMVFIFYKIILTYQDFLNLPFLVTNILYFTFISIYFGALLVLSLNTLKKAHHKSKIHFRMNKEL